MRLSYVYRLSGNNQQQQQQQKDIENLGERFI